MKMMTKMIQVEFNMIPVKKLSKKLYKKKKKVCQAFVILMMVNR